nr:mediator of RNA polymerase II transcription subunit 20 isoform X2 [Caretta caretta]
MCFLPRREREASIYKSLLQIDLKDYIVSAEPPSPSQGLVQPYVQTSGTMGVTCVSQMPVAEGKSVQQTVEILTRKLELLGAEKQGTFCVDCETYHTAASTMGNQGQAGKLMYVMHNSEYPLSCFALFENGPCLIADANFDVLMVKLKGFFQNAKANKIESRGTRYQYCDFLVKVGTVTMGPSARGISVETQVPPGQSGI